MKKISRNRLGPHVPVVAVPSCRPCAFVGWPPSCSVRRTNCAQGGTPRSRKGAGPHRSRDYDDVRSPATHTKDSHGRGNCRLLPLILALKLKGPIGENGAPSLAQNTKGPIVECAGFVILLVCFARRRQGSCMSCPINEDWSECRRSRGRFKRATRLHQGGSGGV